MAHVFPEVARLDGLGDAAVGPVEQRPIGIILDRLEEGICHPDRVVRVLTRNACIGLAVPIGVVGREFDALIALLGVIQHALDVSLGDRNLFGAADCELELLILLGIDRIFAAAIPGADCGEDFVQFLFVHLGAGNDAGDLLLFLDLPVDEFLDIGVVGIADHHFRRAARGATRFDRAGRAVTDFEKTHQTRGFATARKFFTRSAQA